MAAPPVFDQSFRDTFRQLLQWRRDVRRFQTTPLPAGLLEEMLDLTCLAPSVGLSQPWRFLSVETASVRIGVEQIFTAANSAALAGYSGERAALYAKLKLAGLREAPVHLAVFTDTETERGHGLGRQTMPQTMEHSTVAAIHTLWLAARSYGVGLGWVSILDVTAMHALLGAASSWSLTAYLCLGYPEAESIVPELEAQTWESRSPRQALVVR